MRDDINETDLLERFSRGDVHAFKEIYNKSHTTLYAYIIRFVKIPAIGEDILQEVFLKIWEVRARIKSGLSFKAYLYRICRNKIYKVLKKMATDDELRLQLGSHLQNAVNSIEMQLQWQQYETAFNTAVSKLPSQRQKVFRLCRQEGYTYEKVAQELNISRNTVKEHMVLAVRFIKEYLLQHTDIKHFLWLLLFEF